MMQYIDRISDEILKDKLLTSGAVLITGPKACGKTTSAKQFANTIVEFQDEDRRDEYIQIAQIIPSKLLKGKKPILFDEWQDAPKIWGAIRKSVDDIQSPGLYILTGSTSADVDVPHSGTGRIDTLEMMPMSLFETGESNGKISLGKLFNNPEDYEDCNSDSKLDDVIFAICRGGWPATLHLEGKRKLKVVYTIFNSICKTDISKIDGTRKNYKVAKKLMKSYARNICSLASAKTIYDDVISTTITSESTLKRYITSLESLRIISDIDAWLPSIRSKTAMRSNTKRNFIDPSLAVAALGINPEYLDHDFNTLGFLFESLCLRDLKIYSMAYEGELSYYRDRYGLEADAVLHLRDGRYALIEIKLGGNQIEEGAHNLLRIEKAIIEHNESIGKEEIRLPDLKIVITATMYGYRRNDGVYVVPITCLRD